MEVSQPPRRLVRRPAGVSWISVQVLPAGRAEPTTFPTTEGPGGERPDDGRQGLRQKIKRDRADGDVGLEGLVQVNRRSEGNQTAPAPLLNLRADRHPNVQGPQLSERLPRHVDPLAEAQIPRKGARPFRIEMEVDGKRLSWVLKENDDVKWHRCAGGAPRRPSAAPP